MSLYVLHTDYKAALIYVNRLIESTERIVDLYDRECIGVPENLCGATVLLEEAKADLLKAKELSFGLPSWIVERAHNV